MIDKVFSITGNKISSCIVDESSMKFSSSSYENVNSFRDGFAKKLSLATKVEVPLDAIKSITKEENDKKMYIKYKASLGIATNVEFSCNDADDNNILFNFFEKERYFTKTNETLTPFLAIRNYLLGLFLTVALTVIAYHQAIEIANGTVGETHSRRTRMFNNLIELIGDKGVLAIGIAIALFLIYTIWKRFSNPPNQIKLLPPNA